MNNRALADFLRDQHKELMEKDINEYFNMRREAEKHSKQIIETFGDGIVDELFDRQKEIINSLEWDWR